MTPTVILLIVDGGCGLVITFVASSPSDRPTDRPAVVSTVAWTLQLSVRHIAVLLSSDRFTIACSFSCSLFSILHPRGLLSIFSVHVVNKSLEFTINRTLIKLFRAIPPDVIKECCWFFDITDTMLLIAKRKMIFLREYFNSERGL